MATVLNVTEILKRSDGTEVKISGDSKFYAQNNYANLILLDIEDGGSLEACALINFTQQTRQSFTSHNFFMKPVGIVTRVVNDEVINAYQYAIQVPKLVLQNNTKGVIETDLTVTVSFGANYKGYFPNLTNLNISLPPTEQLQNDLSIAYVVELEQFLQVQYNSTTSVYEWVEVDYVDMFLTQKQYSLSSIYIQPGYSSPQGIAPISVSNTQVIMNILNDLEVLYNSLEEGLSSHINDLNNPHEVKANQVPFDNIGTQLISTTTEGAIKEINANERNTKDTVNAILDGTETLREIRMGVEPNVAILRYIHTNGNNYQVVQIEYPDGRMEEINETIPVNYRNETGVTLNSGRVLMSDGTTLGGNPPRGLLFDPTSPNAYKLLGVTTLNGTQPNAKSKITKLGIVHDVLIADLFASGTTYAEGQFLWGRVDGRLSNTPPTKPALQVIVGMIINLTGTKVDILINPIIFEKLADQSDVDMTGVQEGDVIEKRGSLYKPTNRVTQLEVTRELLENKAQDFTTINETLYPSVQATKTELDKKVDKTLTIIGLDLQDNILIGEFRTVLGNATQSVAGLLSAEDKTHLDGLVALLETSDGNNVVDTIGEILDIFQNYPEGADILTALNGKVDKVVGMGLSTNDLTNALKGYYDTAYAHSQIKDKSNPHNTSFANITDKPTTRDGFGITDVYTKPETYTQQEINALFDNLSAVKGLKSTLLTPTELSNGDTISTNLLTNNGAYIVFTATDTSTEEIDSDTVPVSTIKTGKKFVFFDNQEIVFTIGETNSTFETSEDITLKINLLYLDSENVQAIGVDFDGSLTNYLLSQTNVQEAIEKIDNELKTTNDNIDETEADILALETANMIKSITRSGGNLFTITYYDDTTSSLLTLAELKSFIGEATQSLSGLMSAQDKTDLETLMALFDADGDSVVNTIQEILDIFENYPEGADLVTALAGKVNKADIVDNLTTNDATKVLSAKQGKALEDNKEALINKAVDFSVVNDTKYPTTKAVKDLVDATVGDTMLDETPTEDSENLVTSGGVFNALAGKLDASKQAVATVGGLVTPTTTPTGLELVGIDETNEQQRVRLSDDFEVSYNTIMLKRPYIPFYLHTIVTSAYTFYIVNRNPAAYRGNTLQMRNFLSQIASTKWIGTQSFNTFFVYDIQIAIEGEFGDLTPYRSSPSILQKGNAISYFGNDGQEVTILASNFGSFVSDTVTEIQGF